ncbi:glycoside hydrolase family 3 N-terminal domain-containing protein [Lacticaseibacillus sp. GG6-2]
MRGLKLVVAGFIGVVVVAAATTAKAVEAVTLPEISDAQLRTYVNKMSLDEQIGQLFMSRTPSDPAQAQAGVAKYHLGGLVLFGADFKIGSAATLKARVDSYQAKAKIPLLIATDQEGGEVSRFWDSPTLGLKHWPSPQEAYAAGGMAGVLDAAKQTAATLKSVGVNWNFAPIADVAPDPSNYIYDRTFGQGYQATADYIAQVVPAMQDAGVGATLKHFPGYGAAGDTHVGFATVSTPLATLEHQDLLPFKAGIGAGVDGIMVTHIVMKAIDAKYPASLSRKVITGLLRHKLHYDGVIITDGLGMAAITQFRQQYHLASTDVLAVQAGDDAVLNNDYVTGIPAIKAAVAKGTIKRSQIEASDLRILKLKRKLGLLSKAQFIEPHIKLGETTVNKKHTIVHGRVLAKSVAAGSHVSAFAKQHRVATATVADNGDFKLTIPRQVKQQRVMVRVAKTGVKPAAIAVKALPAKAATFSGRWLVAIVAVVVIGLAVAGIMRSRKHR